MILIVTNRRDYTADFLILELQRRETNYVRFNTEDFPQRVQVICEIGEKNWSGCFLFPKRRVDFKDIRSIWYRRPVHPLLPDEMIDPVAREFAMVESQAALEGIWRSLDCFWVSHPDNLRRAELKLYQLKVATNIGFRLGPTLITTSPNAARKFYRDQKGEVVYKPLRRAELKRKESVSLIFTNPVTEEEAREFDRVALAPALLQRYIRKNIEIRVNVIDTKVFAIAIHSQHHPDSQHDWRRGDRSLLRYELHSLPPDIENKCVQLVRSLGLAFGAIDLILTPDGEYFFLEINPNGQWAWIQQFHPDIPLRETLADLLIGGTLAKDV